MVLTELAASLPVILLAEDMLDDVFLVRLAMAKAGLSNPLEVVRDGEEAVAYLGGAEPFGNRILHPFPTLLLLDIQMPRMDGFEVLIWLQEQAQFHRPAVVMLTSFAGESDIGKSRALGADDFRIKSSAIGDLAVMLKELHARWLVAPSKPPPEFSYV